MGARALQRIFDLKNTIAFYIPSLLTCEKSMVDRPQPPLPLRLRIIAWTGFVDMRINKSDNPTHKTYLSHEIKSGLWARYRRGEVVPSGALLEGTNSRVTRIDTDVANGSLGFLRHRFWDLLDFSQFMTPSELKTISLEFKAPLRTLFFAKPNATEESGRADKFWYQQPLTDGESFMELRKHAPLDGLAACLIFVRMAYLDQDAQACMRFYEVGFSIMAVYSMTDLFSTNRMKSVRLVIEYYFFTQIRWLNLNPLDSKTLEPESVADKLFADWRDRFYLHCKELTDPEKKNLKAIVEEIRDIEPSRMVG